MIMRNGVRDTHAWLDGGAEDNWKDADTRSCLYLCTGIKKKLFVSRWRWYFENAKLEWTERRIHVVILLCETLK